MSDFCPGWQIEICCSHTIFSAFLLLSIVHFIYHKNPIFTPKSDCFEPTLYNNWVKHHTHWNHEKSVPKSTSISGISCQKLPRFWQLLPWKYLRNHPKIFLVLKRKKELRKGGDYRTLVANSRTFVLNSRTFVQNSRTFVQGTFRKPAWTLGLRALPKIVSL